MYYVYVLKSESTGNWYTGQTNNLERRIEEHNERKHRYTSNKGPWKLFYHEEVQTRAEAMKREKYFKSGQGRNWLKRTLNGESSPP